MKNLMISIIMMSVAASAFATDDGNTKKNKKTAVQKYTETHNYKHTTPVVKTEEEMQTTGTPAVVPANYKHQTTEVVKKNKPSGEFSNTGTTQTYSNPTKNPRNYKIK